MERIFQRRIICFFLICSILFLSACSTDLALLSKECTGCMSYYYAISGTKLYFFLEFTEAGIILDEAGVSLLELCMSNAMRVMRYDLTIKK